MRSSVAFVFESGVWIWDEGIIGREVPVGGGNSVWTSGLVDTKPGIQAEKINPQIDQKKIRRDNILPIKKDQFQIRRVII